MLTNIVIPTERSESSNLTLINTVETGHVPSLQPDNDGLATTSTALARFNSV